MRALAIALSMCLGALAPATSRAQDDLGPDEAAARELFARGVEAADAGRWEEALARFTETYRILPRPQVLLNLAGAQVHAGRLTAAAEAYRRLEADPDAPAELRDAARDALAALDPRIPRLVLRIDGDRDDDAVHLDEATLAPSERDGEHALDPGRHALRVVRAGAELLREDFRLYEGERLRLDLRVADRAPDRGGPAPAPAPARAEDRWWESPIFWGVLGIVVAGAVGIAIAVSIQPESPFVGNLPPGMITVR